MRFLLYNIRYAAGNGSHFHFPFPYAGYLVAVYFGSVRWPLAVTLGVATAVWVLMALAMIVLWARLHPAAAGA